MKKISLCGLLVCLSLVLSLLERFIPLQSIIPIPAVKLGLSNIVILFSIITLDFKQSFVIFLCKVILSSIFSASITAFLFSFLGGLLSLITMFILIKFNKNWFSIYGISVAGSATHNIGQIIAAIFVLKSVYIVSYLPALLFCSFPVGIITGYISKRVICSVKKNISL